MNSSVNFEKVKYLYGAVPLILSIHIMSALFFIIIMWQYVDNESLLIWVAVFATVMLFRLYHYLLYSNSSEKEIADEDRLWLHRYNTYTLIGGALWGSTALLFFPEHDLLYQMIVVLFILATTSTAIGIISASWYVVVTYSILSFAPMIIRMAWMEDPIYQTIGYIVAALGILMIFAAKHLGSVIEKTIENKFALQKVSSDLDTSMNQFYTFIDYAPIGIFIFDADMKIVKTNERMSEIFQVPSHELIGYDLQQVADNRILPALQSTLELKEGQYEGTFYSSFSENTLFINLFCVPMRGTGDKPNGGVCFFKDQTSEMQAKESVQANAFYDPLTKLPNRILFADRLTIAIEQSRRHEFAFSVLFLDLDHFKHVNDNLGHYIGDQLLYQVSQRLLSCVRAEDTVARIGGDEFIILLNSLPHDEERTIEISMDVASKIIDTVGEEYHIEEHCLNIGGSIGIYIYDGDEILSPSEIIKKADIAMYNAKRSGRNHATLYHEDFEQSQQEYIAMDKDLRRAMEQNELILYYQPKVSIKTNEIEQVEALIRWNHPELGLVFPKDFIPFAEESGIIVKIGEWVIEKSLRQIKSWTENGEMKGLKRVSINISSQQFELPDFTDYLKAAVMVHNVDPSMLEIELTETIMLNNSKSAVEKIKELETFGIKVALDDFGTGYSSLSYLKNLPVSVIKIDRSFVVDLKDNQHTMMIVRTIISVAKSMGLSVVAEGVENETELAVLEQLGCDYYQGFLCHAAVPAIELEALVTHQKQSSKSLF